MFDEDEMDFCFEIALVFGGTAVAQTPIGSVVPGSEKVVSERVISIGGRPVEETPTQEAAPVAEEPEKLNEEAATEEVVMERVERRICTPTGCQVVYEMTPVVRRLAAPVIAAKERREIRQEVRQEVREIRASLAEEFELAVIERVNAYRAQAGLPPLAADEEQCVGARQHSQFMASRGRLVHASGFAECIAQTGADADAVVSLWMNSVPHRAIIMSGGRSTIAVGHFGQFHTLRVW